MLQQNRQIRILHMYHDIFANGGVESFFSNVCSVLESDNIHCDVLTTAFCTNEEFIKSLKTLGVEYYQLNKDKTSFLKGCLDTIKRLPPFIEKHSYDIVHVHSCSPINSGIIFRLLKRCGVRKIIHHAHLSSENMNLIMAIKWKAKQMIGFPLISDIPILNLSPSCSASISSFPRKAFKNNRVKFVPNAIDCKKYAFDAVAREEIRYELGICDDQLLVGHIGRFSPPKNHFFLIDIFKEVCNKIPNCKLCLVGEGELETQIVKKVSKLGLKDSVIFFGTTNKPESMYSAFDVLLFPSLFEALGIVGVEAQTACLPVIASEHLPKELDLTDMFIRVPLSANATNWADKVFDYANTKRIDNVQIIEEKGWGLNCLKDILLQNYDIVMTADI